VVSFQDIDTLKRNLEQAQLYADALSDTARQAILVLDSNLRVTNANPAFYRNFGVSREEPRIAQFMNLGDKQWNIPQLRELLEKILTQQRNGGGLRSAPRLPHLGPRVMMLNARRIEPQPGQQLILLHLETRPARSSLTAHARGTMPTSLVPR